MDVTYFRRSDYAFNKKLLALLGLWPTARSKFRIVLFYTYYVSYLLFQTTWFFTLECDFTCVVNIISIILPNAMVLLNYAYRHKYMTTIHSLYMAIDLDRNSFKNDKQSIEILRRYATMVHILSVTYMFLACVCTVVVLTTTLSMVSVPHVPKENYSSFWQRPVALTKLEKTLSSYNPSFILCVATYCLNSFIWGGIELTHLAFSEHVCALFTIVSSQLKRATNDYVMNQCDKTNDIYTKIILAVCVHTRAIKYLQIMWDTFETYYFCTVLSGSTILSTTAVSFCLSLQTEENGRAIILTLYIILTVLSYAVSVTLVGQRLIDHSSDVFYETYNSYWYRMPLKVQKMYLMILLRSIRSCSFSKGQLFALSFKGLSTVLNTTFSYITVFYSMQK